MIEEPSRDRSSLREDWQDFVRGEFVIRINASVQGLNPQQNADMKGGIGIGQIFSQAGT